MQSVKVCIKRQLYLPFSVVTMTYFYFIWHYDLDLIVTSCLMMNLNSIDIHVDLNLVKSSPVGKPSDNCQLNLADAISIWYVSTFAVSILVILLETHSFITSMILTVSFTCIRGTFVFRLSKYTLFKFSCLSIV